MTHNKGICDYQLLMIFSTFNFDSIVSLVDVVELKQLFGLSMWRFKKRLHPGRLRENQCLFVDMKLGFI